MEISEPEILEKIEEHTEINEEPPEEIPAPKRVPKKYGQYQPEWI